MASTQGSHSEVPSEEPSGFPPFEPSTYASQLFWLAIAFVLLYALMAKVTLPRIGSIIEARRARIDDDVGEASRLKTEAEQAIAAYEQSIADARDRAQTIAAETREKLNIEAEKRRQSLDTQLNAKLAEAEKTITMTRTQAMASVRGIAIEAVPAIVARLTNMAPTDSTVAGAVDAVLRH